MKKCIDKLIELTERLFPEQLTVYDISTIDIKKGNDSMLHQHFLEPLSDEEQQELVNQIAWFLNNQDEDAVYSFFKKHTNIVDVEAKWYVSSARLKKNEDDTSIKVILFTYDLELIGECKDKLYQVIEDLNFLKKKYTKVSLLTKRETEIMGLMALGRTSIEIGEQLYISEHTVNTHRKNIKKKLEIKTLADLLKYAAVFDNTTNE